MNTRENALIALSVLLCVCLYSLVVWFANDHAAKELSYILQETPKCNLSTFYISDDSLVIIQEQLLLEELEAGLFDLRDRYANSLKHNYPWQLTLMLLGLVTTIIAVFLNVLAVSKGWANIGTAMRGALMITLLCFVTVNYLLPIMKYGEHTESAYKGYSGSERLLRDFNEYVNTRGSAFLNKAPTQLDAFMGYMYGRIADLPDMTLQKAIELVPSHLEVAKMFDRMDMKQPPRTPNESTH